MPAADQIAGVAAMAASAALISFRSNACASAGVFSATMRGAVLVGYHQQPRTHRAGHRQPCGFDVGGRDQLARQLARFDFRGVGLDLRQPRSLGHQAVHRDVAGLGLHQLVPDESLHARRKIEQPNPSPRQHAVSRKLLNPRIGNSQHLAERGVTFDRRPTLNP